LNLIFGIGKSYRRFYETSNHIRFDPFLIWEPLAKVE